ncbi:MAG: ATP-binding protein [Anaerolineales bacterium]
MKLRLDGLRLQLLGLFILPVTLIVLAVAIGATGLHRQAMRSLVAERDERAVASAAAGLDQALHSKLEAIDVALALMPEQPEVSLEHTSAGSLQEFFPLVYALTDEQGNLQAGQVLPAELLASMETAETRIFAAQIEDTKAVIFTGEDETSQLMGAVALRDLVRAAGLDIAGSHSDIRIFLINQDTEVLISMGGPPPSSLQDHPGVRASLRGERGSFFLAMDDGEHVVAYAPIPSAGWGLIMEEPWESVSSSLLDLSLLAPFSLAPILLLTMLGLWFGARRVVQPLRRLDEAASGLPRGDTGPITQPIGGIHEIEQLRETLVQMSDRIQEAQTALRAYIGALTNAQEEERRRVARELHDESIQHWIALDHSLQMAADRLRQQDIAEAELLVDLHHQVQEGIQELRRLSRGLRPIFLEDLGLIPAIEMLARDAQDALGIPIRFSVTGKQRRLPTQVELTIYRLVQEGLTNISRHAEASAASVNLTYLQDSLELIIRDDGRGFRLPAQFEALTTAGHFGLMGMQERADSIDAELEIESAPGAGTTVRLIVPTF